MAGVINTTYTFTATDLVTSTKINNTDTQLKSARLLN